MIFKTILKKGSNLVYKLLLCHVYSKARYSNVTFQKSNFLITVVAFNNADLIKLQYTKLKELFREPFDYLVADNSSDKNISNNLRDFCAQQNISYVLLPKNPLTGMRASGSHGVALNWCYRNIIQTYKPTHFGFLDHDIFPLREIQLTPKLDLGFYGAVRTRKEPYWYLWPGFSFFTHKHMQNFSVNFFPYHGGHDGSIFLDTGGSNYNTIYKHLGRTGVREARSRLINRTTNTDFIKGEDSSQTFEIIDNSWLHLRQIAWRAESSNKLDELEDIISSAKKFLS